MIVSATYIRDYQLKIVFDDESDRIIDLEKFFKESSNPLIKKYYNIELFKKFKIDYGTLCWGDNECDINPTNIYNGEYDLN